MSTMRKAGMWWTIWSAVMILPVLLLVCCAVSQAQAVAASQPVSQADDIHSNAVAAVQALRSHQWAYGFSVLALVVVWILRHVVGKRLPWFTGRLGAGVLSLATVVATYLSNALVGGKSLDEATIVACLGVAITAALTIWPVQPRE